MSKERQKYLFACILTVLLVLSAGKYLDDFIITPSEAASTVLREIANEKKIYQISEEQIKGIKALFDSCDKYNLPHIEITKVISEKKNDFLERVIFTKSTRDNRWIMVPKKMGDTDESYIKRNCIGNYLLQDISLESRQNAGFKDSFIVISKINYSEFNKGTIIKRYIGSATFILRKLSFNQWIVEAVDSTPFVQENNV